MSSRGTIVDLLKRLKTVAKNLLFTRELGGDVKYTFHVYTRSTAYRTPIPVVAKKEEGS